MRIPRAAIRDQAAHLEGRLWNIARKLGLKRTTETKERLNLILSGIITSQSLASKRLVTSERYEHGLEALQSASRDESELAYLFLLVWSILDHDEIADDAFNMLCGDNYLAGILEGKISKRSKRAKTPDDMRENLRKGEAREAYNEQRSVDAFKAASVLGKLRHAENYALADEALKFWRENIDPNLSAEKAATKLVRVVPLSHKKLAAVVSAEKKKQH